jgi:Domain of unknown function (DUF4149)
VKGQLAMGIELTVLALWLGAAILVAAVVAPAAFAVLPSRSLAGDIVGRILPVVFVSGIAAALIAAACEMTVSRTGFSIRVTAPLVALAAGCAIAQFVIAPRIDRIRVAAGGSVDALGRNDPNRVMFGKLHAISVLWFGVAMLGALWAIASQLYSSRQTPTL